MAYYSLDLAISSPMDLEDDPDFAPEPDFPLPEGISKEILTEAATSEWRQPKVGDEVTIRCTAVVTWDDHKLLCEASGYRIALLNCFVGLKWLFCRPFWANSTARCALA